MKRIIIKNKHGHQTNGAEMIDPTEWIDSCVKSNVWGFPERIVDDIEGTYNEEDVLEKFQEIISPEIQEVMNDAGEIVQEFVPAVIKKQVKLKAEYSVEITDITAQIEQEKINAESLKYLQDTDWYIIREMDSGVPCPVEIKTARANARSAIIN